MGTPFQDHVYKSMAEALRIILLFGQRQYLFITHKVGKSVRTQNETVIRGRLDLKDSSEVTVKC